MSKLILKVKKAQEDGRSQVEIVLGKNRLIAQNSDEIISTLDKLLKKSKMELESVKHINLRIDKKAGLTSQRIAKAVVKALNLNLD